MAFHPNYADEPPLLRQLHRPRRRHPRRRVPGAAAAAAPVARRASSCSSTSPTRTTTAGSSRSVPTATSTSAWATAARAAIPENRAQNLSSRLGKMLRIDVDQAPARTGRSSATACATRGASASTAQTGDLYIGDVGQDELGGDRLHARARSAGLENYGWDVLEGNHALRGHGPSGGGELVFPIDEYSHEQGCSVTGGYVYRGSSIPAAEGRYFFGDYCTGTIWSLVVEAARRPTAQHSFRVEALSSFGEGPAASSSSSPTRARSTGSRAALDFLVGSAEDVAGATAWGGWAAASTAKGGGMRAARLLIVAALLALVVASEQRRLHRCPDSAVFDVGADYNSGKALPFAADTATRREPPGGPGTIDAGGDRRRAASGSGLDDELGTIYLKNYTLRARRAHRGLGRERRGRGLDGHAVPGRATAATTASRHGRPGRST